nr:hypothetical protein [Tanacetum cinerariifolium]
MSVGSPVLPPPLQVRPLILPPRDAVVDRPALHVVILGGIIYIREDIGGNKRHDGELSVITQGVNIEKSKCIETKCHNVLRQQAWNLCQDKLRNTSHSLNYYKSAPQHQSDTSLKAQNKTS